MSKKSLFLSILGFLGLISLFTISSIKYLNNGNDNASVLGSNTFKIPVIGSNTLEKPEDYKLNIKTDNNGFNKLSVNKPSKVLELNNTKYGFSLNANSKQDLEGITFIFENDKGERSDEYIIEISEDQIDRDGNPTNKASTEAYLFASGIKKLEFYYNGEKDFKIYYHEFENNSFKTLSTPTDDPNHVFKTNFIAPSGLNIITRAQMGLPEENIFASSGWTPPYYQVNRIVVHHTATGVDMNNPINTVKAIWNNHTYTQDWGDFGYNYLIDPYGNIYEGRAGFNGVRGNHAPPNENTIGISLLGDFTNQLPTQASLESLVRLMAYLSYVNRIDLNYKTGYNSASPMGVYGHRAINATACPGNTFFPVLDQVVNAAQSYKSSNYEIKNKIESVDNLIDNKDFFVNAGKAHILINTKNISNELKTKIENPPSRLANTINNNGLLIYSVEEAQMKQLMTELKLTAPNAIVQPDYKYELTAWVEDAGNERSVPTDYDNSLHWNLEQIKAPEAWYYLYNNTSPQSHTGSSDVTIAVLDTGVAYENYTLDSNFNNFDRSYYISPDLSSVNFVSPYNAGWEHMCYYYSYYFGSQCSGNDILNLDHANDDDGHGTFVTSIIASNIADSSPNVILGISPSVNIMPVKVFLPNVSYLGDEKGASYTSMIAWGIFHAMNNGADVINMSLGAPLENGDPLLEDTVNDAYNAGIVLVAASGNSNSDVVFFPASLDNVIAVGASNKAGNNRANYSNYGPELDVVAPVGSDSENGVIATSINCFTNKYGCDETSNLSLFPSNGSYIEGWGTSFAAPQVAAQAALIMSLYPSISNPMLIYHLVFTGSDINQPGFDNNTGWGIIDLFQSLQEELNIETPTTANLISKKYYFPIYNNGGPEWTQTSLELSNPNLVNTEVKVTIGSDVYGYNNEPFNGNNPYIIPAEGSIQIIYPPVIRKGPLIVESTNDSTFIAGSRAVWKSQALSEDMGLPESLLSTKYYFPIYNNGGPEWTQTSLELSNPNSTAAHIIVTIGEQIYGANNQVFNGSNPYIIPPFSNIQITYPPIIRRGPLIVESINAQTFVAGSRAVWKSQALSEDMGLPLSLLSTKYFFPIYNNGGPEWTQTSLELSNPHDSQVELTVTIGDVVFGTNNEIFNGTNPYVIQPHNNIQILYPPIIRKGPLIIESINAQTFVAGSRAVWKSQALSEDIGLPESILTRHYSLPIYNNGGPEWTQTSLELSNPNASEVEVSVTIGEITYGNNNELYDGSNPYIIPAKSNIQIIYPPIIRKGPLLIKSINGLDFIAGGRAVWKSQALSEQGALPSIDKILF